MQEHIRQGLQAYKQNMASTTMDEVVKQYSPVVKKIALHLYSRLPKSVVLEDLIQAGMIGLIEAHQRYDDTNTASFETFASTRIRGAMIDELRRNHWAPRSTHQNIRKVTEAIRAVETRLQRTATPQEIADELNIPVNEYFEILDDMSANEVLCLDEVTEDRYLSQSDSNPEQAVSQENLVNYLIENLKKLPEREQLILSLYYNEEFNFKEIGKILDITEARVSQLHSQAIARLISQVKR